MNQPQSNLIPMKFTTTELASILRDISARIEMGDSIEGHIFYTAVGEYYDDLQHDEWEVRGVYRIGNLDGQGGVRMIGDVPNA